MLITVKKILANYGIDQHLWVGIPSIELTKKGRTFLTFYSGGVKEEIGNHCMLIRSEDGKNYSDPIAVCYADGYRCFDPCLWIDPLGRLCFTWARYPDDGVVGIFSKTENAAFIKAMGFAGADFVIIDLAHGPNTIRSAQNLIRAAQLSGVFPIIRVKKENPSVMAEALNIGAGGIQVPQITNPAAAREVMDRTKFSPLGSHGVCRFVRAANYSAKDRFQYFQDANNAVIVLQIAGKDGIDNLDAILETPGIDVISIGPYDLSQSLGVVGDIDNPLVEQEMLRIVKKCSEKNITVGTFTDTVENARKWRRLGVKYIANSVDVGIFHDAVKALMTDIKSE